MPWRPRNPHLGFDPDPVVALMASPENCHLHGVLDGETQVLGTVPALEVQIHSMSPPTKSWELLGAGHRPQCPECGRFRRTTVIPQAT